MTISKFSLVVPPSGRAERPLFAADVRVRHVVDWTQIPGSVLLPDREAWVEGILNVRWFGGDQFGRVITGGQRAAEAHERVIAPGVRDHRRRPGVWRSRLSGVARNPSRALRVVRSRGTATSRY